ncbi:hypothetical protein OIU78_026695 [Salix suchowensis]|nr:hypothetical protein OIU78_026695 [Salix suchowensis]
MLTDAPHWEHSASGVCTIQSAWEQARVRRPQNGGMKLIWHKWHIPRHSFVLWLASRGRLRTMDRLHNQQLPQAPCMLCHSHVEDHNHLFFRCSYSAEVWDLICHKANIQWPSISWGLAWDRAVQNQATSQHSRILGMVLAATIYHLWQERNRRMHNQHYGSPKKMVEEIIAQMRTRLATFSERGELMETTRRQWDVQ